jgi:hypothetical protein
VQNGIPTFATIFCAIRLRHSVLLHLTEICPGVLFQNIPENDQPRIVQNGFSGFSTMFYIFTLRNQIRCIMLLFHYNKKSLTKA